MKSMLVMVLFVAFIGLLSATDIILNTGSTVIGTLYGIKDGGLYVVTSQQQLVIIPKADIAQINDGNGDVSFVWLHRADFMKDLPEGTTLSEAQTSSPSLLYTPPPKMPAQSETDKQLQSISAALWTMTGIYVITTVVAVLTYIHAIKKPATP